MKKYSFVILYPLVLSILSPQNIHALGQDSSWNGNIKPHVARDLNPDPDIVEIILVATESYVSFDGETNTTVWTYNGTTPGPTIEGNVGDTLIVHFFNNLSEETTVHWHGVKLPANMDGSNISQKAVPPGGYFRYEFNLLEASTFWYHPHIRTNEQVEKGLYGALIVHDPNEDKNLGLPENEHVLLLDDILLDEKGQVAEPFPSEPRDNALTQVNGRIGNMLLVNGRSSAEGTIQRGVPHRLRLINTTNARFMRVSIRNHRMWRIGGDGGLLESPIEILPIELVPDPDPTHGGQMISDPDPSKGLLLTPGERADIVFTPNQGEDRVYLEWHDIARGRHTAYNISGNIILSHQHHDGLNPAQILLTLELFGDQEGEEYIPPQNLRVIEPLDTTDADQIMVMFGHTDPDPNGNVTFFAAMKNQMPLPFPLVTPDDAPIATVGGTYIINVTNMTGGDHNFHIHGFQFQWIDTEFIDIETPNNNYIVPAPYLEWKDTILIPRRPGAKGTSRTITRLAVHIDDTGREGLVEAFGKKPGDDTSGGWVFHCHLLEHADRGMMSFLQVFYP
jgi:FtsP/CotA-like multicopper oxidase with cupredoxin domain